MTGDVVGAHVDDVVDDDEAATVQTKDAPRTPRKNMWKLLPKNRIEFEHSSGAASADRKTCRRPNKNDHWCDALPRWSPMQRVVGEY